jgi:hypothetical protein
MQQQSSSSSSVQKKKKEKDKRPTFYTGRITRYVARLVGNSYYILWIPTYLTYVSINISLPVRGLDWTDCRTGFGLTSPTGNNQSQSQSLILMDSGGVREKAHNNHLFRLVACNRCIHMGQRIGVPGFLEWCRLDQ